MLLIALFLNVATILKAQTGRDSVMATINRFFEGMKKADTGLLKSTLSNSAILQTIVDEKGVIKVKDEKISEFISFVGQQTPGDTDEQIEIGTVNIDGPLASVWTPYKFYYKSKFSHCGVNSFQLVKFSNEWKIQFIIDTRKRVGCKE